MLKLYFQRNDPNAPKPIVASVNPEPKEEDRDSVTLENEEAKLENSNFRQNLHVVLDYFPNHQKNG